jgi:hypothetical protein
MGRLPASGLDEVPSALAGSGDLQPKGDIFAADSLHMILRNPIG